MRKFTGLFSPTDLDNVLHEISVMGHFDYLKLIEMEKWLELFIKKTDEVIKKYENGYDMAGVIMLKESAIWHNELRHFSNKRKRLQIALEACRKKSLFK